MNLELLIKHAMRLASSAYPHGRYVVMFTPEGNEVKYEARFFEGSQWWYYDDIRLVPRRMVS